MASHYCDSFDEDDDGFWFAICGCKYRTPPVPDIDIMVDLMMEHAALMVRVGKELEALDADNA